jgi:hypothetical protein
VEVLGLEVQVLALVVVLVGHVGFQVSLRSLSESEGYPQRVADWADMLVPCEVHREILGAVVLGEGKLPLLGCALERIVVGFGMGHASVQDILLVVVVLGEVISPVVRGSVVPLPMPMVVVVIAILVMLVVMGDSFLTVMRWLRLAGRSLRGSSEFHERPCREREHPPQQA